ncbi:MAG: 50S ribosomal protein L21 [Patescibacteria group bacterium]
MTIAVIKTGGKQYKVAPAQQVKIEKIDGQAGDKVSFNALLVFDDAGKEFDLGMPNTSKKVEAEIVEQGRAKKIDVIKFKSKVRYRRKYGHRQPFTQVKILSVGGVKASASKKEPAKKPAVKKATVTKIAAKAPAKKTAKK